MHLQTTLINNLSKTEAMTMSKNKTETKTSSRCDAVVSTLSQTEHHKSLFIKVERARKSKWKKKNFTNQSKVETSMEVENKVLNFYIS